MSGSGSGIGGDIMGGLQLLGGGVATILGQPEIGIPLMVGGASSIVGGNLGGGSGGSSGGLGSMLGGLGGLGSIFGGGGGASGPSFAPPFMSSSGAPPISMGPASQGQQLANLGAAGFPGAQQMSGLGGLSSAAPPVSITPTLGGGTNSPLSGNLNPNLTGAVQPGGTGLAPQDSNSVGQAYADYLKQSQALKYRTGFAQPHSSQVVAPQLNPFAPNQSSPINPPQLVV